LTARVASVHTFHCPSDSRGGTGAVNYAGCHHDLEAPIAVDNHGVLFLNSRVRHDDLVDGPAYTILLGETTDRPPLGWASGTRATLRNTGTALNDFKVLIPPGSPAAALAKAQAGDMEALASFVENSDLIDPMQRGLLIVDFVGGFASHHQRGANFLFCDGSVRLVKDTVDSYVYQLLGHRADGELISDDAF
jgi:prepilin-type processing-associated H-X9-DG protein